MRAGEHDILRPWSGGHRLWCAGCVLALVAVVVWFAFARWRAAGGPQLIGSILELVAFVYFAVVSVALAAIDVGTHTLPNRIVVPGYLVSAMLLGAASVVVGDVQGLLTMLAGGAALFALYFVIAVGVPHGMGFGDVKLAGVLGLYLGHVGIAAVIVGAFGAFVLGGLFSAGLLVTRRAGRGTGIPFGPWMLVGAWAGIVGGGPLASSYLTVVGIAA